MKSIPLALTWEFWRQAGVALFTTVAVLAGLMSLLYGGLRLDRLDVSDHATFAGLHLFCFIFVVVGLSAVICHSTASPQYRFTLPVSIRASALVPMINGAIATAIGYLAVAVLVNWLFNANWNLVKPTMMAVCMVAVCQAVAWMIWSSANLRGTVIAGVSTVLGVAIIYLNELHCSTPGQFIQEWRTIRPLDISLAIFVPILACTFSLALLTLARRGQVFSMTTIGRWLFAKLDIRFSSDPRVATPMSAELWSEWTVRGRVMPAGAILIAMTLCGFFLSGRFAWRSACDGIAIFTWLQIMSHAIVGLFLGHVGERFDFHEHLATRPLSDIQLADVKLRNTLKSAMWTWITWTIGVAVAVVCLTLVGQGPKSWSDLVPPETPPLLPILIVTVIPLCDWTLTSLGVSVGILRPWAINVGFSVLALLPGVPFLLMLVIPESMIEGFLQWCWIGFSLVGTMALYVTALRLRLMTTKRAVVVCITYLIVCAVCLSLVSFLPPPQLPLSRAIGLLLSSCMLPFVCIAAVPLAIWWNRHR